MRERLNLFDFWLDNKMMLPLHIAEVGCKKSAAANCETAAAGKFTEGSKSVGDKLHSCWSAWSSCTTTGSSCARPRRTRVLARYKLKWPGVQARRLLSRRRRR